MRWGLFQEIVHENHGFNDVGAYDVPYRVCTYTLIFLINIDSVQYTNMLLPHTPDSYQSPSSHTTSRRRAPYTTIDTIPVRQGGTPRATTSTRQLNFYRHKGIGRNQLAYLYWYDMARRLLRWTHSSCFSSDAFYIMSCNAQGIYIYRYVFWME